MTTPADRGWGNPTAAGYASRNFIQVEAGGISLRVHKEIAPLVQLFLTIIVTRGYRVAGKVPDDWGALVRPIRGYERLWKVTHALRYLSNHSWGLAFDLNATTNPMTSDSRNHTDMPAWVIEVARSLGFEWGGDYTGKRHDPMHFEWTGSVGGARAKVAAMTAFFKGIKK